MKKGKISGLLPIAIFLMLYFGGGLFFHDFYAMPAVTIFLTAFLAAFMQNPKKSLTDKLSAAAKSMGEENVMIMCLIFIMAGAFSGAVQAAGGVDSTVNFGLSVLPPRIAVAGLFFISCFISLAMGTSVGTIAALTPIAAGLSQKTGFAGAMCVGAVVCGAMFGDNLSMISDTTIAATRTQNCEMKDKFRENIKIVLPAAILSAFLFLFLSWNAEYEITGELRYNLIKIAPYLVVLAGALLGFPVIAVLAAGTVLSIIVGVVSGSIAFTQIFSVLAFGTDGNGGISNMYDILVISILVAGIMGLVRENGGVDFILYHIKCIIKGKKGAQLGIAALSSLVDVSTANNTIAIVIAGPIAKEIAGDYGIEPKRTAALLDIFTSAFQGLLPYGAQLLYASAGAASAGLSVLPLELFPYLFYPVLMAICGGVSIIFYKEKKAA